jgi:hypothetical protein
VRAVRALTSRRRDAERPAPDRVATPTWQLRQREGTS